MKRCGSIFALFLMFFAVSCDNGLKFNNPNDKNSDAYRGGDADSEGTDDDAERPAGREQGGLYGECYPNKTCNEGLKCDVLNNICMKDADDLGDTASDGDYGDSGDTVPTDAGDTTPDGDFGDSGDTGAFCGNNIVEGDETCDGGTKECTALSSAFSGGYAVCRDDCRGWYSDNCISSQVVPDDDSWDQGNTDPTDTGDTDPADTGNTTPPDTGDTSDSGDTSNTSDTGDSGDTGNTGDTESDTAPADTLTLGNICTGQNKCYGESGEITCPSSSSADFFGQDAQYTSKCTAQSFSASSNVVVDNNTGLTWEKSPSSSKYTWTNRNKHCNELNSSNYAGINTWRVPNPLELLTIVDNNTSDPAMNYNFIGMPTTGDYIYMWTNKLQHEICLPIFSGSRLV